MRLTLSTLPKLAVSAKLLCLLMVVICGAVPSMVRSVRLYNVCSYGEVRVDMRGRVFADDDADPKLTPFRNLTVRSLDFSVKLTIFAEESKRFLCFNHKWRLIGSKRFRGARCQFYENMVQNGYNRFRSVADETKFMGFNSRGKPLRMVAYPRHPQCLDFMKRDEKFDIPAHNRQMQSRMINESTNDMRRKSKRREVLRTTTPKIRHNKNHPRHRPLYLSYP